VDKEKLIELLKSFPGNPKILIGIQGQRNMLQPKQLVGILNGEQPMGILTIPGQDISVDTIGILL
jgi:hypothetical protein